MHENLSTKTKICNAAINLFAKDGYYNCSLRQIASLVGIKPASIYNHFPSKEDILNSILFIFENEYAKYRVPVQTILKAAETEPLVDTFLLVFYTFGADDERFRMLNITRIVASMQYKNELAGSILYRVLISEGREYLAQVTSGLATMGIIKDMDYNWINHMINSSAFTIYNELLLSKADTGTMDYKFREMTTFIANFFVDTFGMKKIENR